MLTNNCTQNAIRQLSATVDYQRPSLSRAFTMAYLTLYAAAHY